MVQRHPGRFRPAGVALFGTLWCKQMGRVASFRYLGLNSSLPLNYCALKKLNRTQSTAAMPWEGLFSFLATK